MGDTVAIMIVRSGGYPHEAVLLSTRRYNCNSYSVYLLMHICNDRIHGSLRLGSVNNKALGFVEGHWQ